ncbi:MAG: sigma-E processing peptidase SpoIIGA [Lachnospiraceae bacterium]
MQVVVYVDIIFLINFIVNCIVLFLVKILLHQYTSWWKILIAGLVSAITLLFFVPTRLLFYPGTGTLIYIGISIEANLLCFGYKNGLLNKWLLSTTLMILIGSGMNYIKYILGFTEFGFSRWLICFFTTQIIVYVIIVKLINLQKNSKQIYTVRFTKNNISFIENMYMDTGNFLWDPLFQKAVIVLSEKSIKSCFTVEEYRLLRNYKEINFFDYKTLLSSEMQRKYCFHEIRYESVGKENGKLLCFLMDEVEIIDEEIKLYKQPVAIVPEELFKGKSYQGLLQQDCIST